ncbi:hypothetical protein JFL47_04530 [Haemophilus haemoglobinophilus]|nr:hypothetical protein [Canicola haemoglobinophilus]
MSIQNISITNQTFTAQAGKTYQIVDAQGKPLTEFFTKISKENGVDQLQILSSEQDETPLLIIENYQDAYFVAPENANIKGGFAISSSDSAIAKEVVLAEEVSLLDRPVFWWIAGGAAAVGGLGLALSGSSSGGDSKVTEQPVPQPAPAPAPAPPKEPPVAKEKPITKPTVELNVSEDNKINKNELTKDIPVKLNITDLDADATAKIVLKNGNTTIGSLNVSKNGEHSIQIEAGKLSASGQIVAEISVSNQSGKSLSTFTTKPLNFVVDGQISQPTLEIGNVTANNIITKSELNQNIPISVKVKNLDTDSKAKVILYDNGVELDRQTISSGSDIRELTFNIAANRLTSGKLSAKIEAGDAAGNTESNTANKDYQVKTTVTEPQVEILTIAGDGIINIEDNKVAQNVVVKVSNLEAGATAKVQLWVGNEKVAEKSGIQQNADDITLSVPAGKLASSPLKAKIEVTDQHGETASNESSKNFTIDTALGTPTLAVTALGEDNIINKAEFDANKPQTIKVNVTNLDTTPNTTTTVSLWQGTKQLGQGKQVSQNGEITFTINSKNIAASPIYAKAQVTDTAGNSTEVRSVDFSFRRDVEISQPTLEIGNVTANNIITKSELNQNIPISVKVKNLDTDSKAKVILYDNGIELDRKTIGLGSNIRELTFNIAANRLTSGKLSAKIEAGDAAGNTESNTANKDYQVKTTVTEPQVEILTIAGDNVINIEDNKVAQNVVVKVSNLEAGATAKVQLWVGNEKVAEKLEINSDGNITLSVPAGKLASSPLKAKIEVTDLHGETASNESSKTFTIDTALNKPTLAVTALGEDNIINKAEFDANKPQAIKVNVSNLDADATATVSLWQGTQQLGSNQKVSQNGEVTFTINSQDIIASPIYAKAQVTDTAGNSAEVRSENFSFRRDVKLTNPEISVHSVSGDNIINATEQAQPQTKVKVNIANIDQDATATVKLYNKANELIKTVENVTTNGEQEIDVPTAKLTGGAVRAEIISTDGANTISARSAVKTFSYDTGVSKPTVTLNSISSDNRINAEEAKTTIPLALTIANLDNDATASIVLKNGNTEIGTLEATQNGSQTIQIEANKLSASGQIVAEISVSDRNSNSIPTFNSAPLAFAVDTSIEKPVLTATSIGELSIEGTQLKDGKALSSKHLANNNTKLNFVLPNLEDGSNVELKVVINGTPYTSNQTVSSANTGSYSLRSTEETEGAEANTNNQKVTTMSIDVPTEVLKQATSYSATVKVTDAFGNEASSETSTVNYTVDLTTAMPTVAINQINDAATSFQLSAESIVNEVTVPVSFTVNNLDSDAKGALSLKVGEHNITATKVLNSENKEVDPQALTNGTYKAYVLATDLAKDKNISASVKATDINENSSIGKSTPMNYEVEPFFGITDIANGFTVSMSDSRLEGINLSGSIQVESGIPDNIRAFQKINDGDLWRWVHSVNIIFDDGTEIEAPVQHEDPDNDKFTADPNKLTYSVQITPTEWARLAGKSFKITSNLLKNHDGSDVTPTIYVGKYHKTSFARGDRITAPKRTISLDDTENFISKNESTEYPYTLNANPGMAKIKGIATGDNIAPGTKVKIFQGKELLGEVLLKEDKSFELDVPLAKLRSASSPTIIATIETTDGNTLTSERNYEVLNNPSDPSSSNSTPSDTAAQQENNADDVAFKDLPYFIRGLLWETIKDSGNLGGGQFGNGYIKNTDGQALPAGSAITIKYHFVSPDDNGWAEYQKKHNQASINSNDPDGIYHDVKAFSEENKAAIRQAMKNISDQTNIQFVESEDRNSVIADGSGMNFIMHDVQDKNASAFAYYGGDVTFDRKSFQNPDKAGAEKLQNSNHGMRTAMHEIMHGLGLKHTHISVENDNAVIDNKNSFSVYRKLKAGEAPTATCSCAGCASGGECLVGGSNPAEDTSMMSLMSYNRNIDSYDDKLRPYDLATLHYLYGVNRNVNAGNDHYTFKPFNPRNSTGDMYIADGAGNDALNAATEKAAEPGKTSGVLLDLREGHYSYRKDSVFAKEFNAAADEDKMNVPFMVSERPNTTEKDFFNDPNFTLRDNDINILFNEDYPNYTERSGVLFIGYGSKIENAIGSAFDDTLRGNKLNNILEAGAGNDQLYGEEGNDLLYGEAGDDELHGGDSWDTLRGGIGNDKLYGEDGGDLLYGGDGDDLLYGGDGDDHLHGGDGDDQLHGGIDNDKLYGGDGQDELHGGDGYDTLRGGIGNDKLYGENGYDELHGEDGDDLLYGGDGDDQLHGGDGDDQLHGGDGDDLLYGGDGNDILIGGKGEDFLQGGKGDDRYYFYPSDVNNTLGTATITDHINDTEGNNTLVFAGSGHDFKYTTIAGMQTLELENDNNLIYMNGMGPYSLVKGGEGNNTFSFWEANPINVIRYHIDGGEGHDRVVFNSNTSGSVKINMSTFSNIEEFQLGNGATINFKFDIGFGGKNYLKFTKADNNTSSERLIFQHSDGIIADRVGQADGDGKIYDTYRNESSTYSVWVENGINVQII